MKPRGEQIRNNRYPHTPGHRRGAPETSRLAAESMASSAKTIRAKVLAVVASSGAAGVIGDDVANALDLHVTQVRSRLSELVAGKKVADSKKRRKGASGRSGCVWVLPEFAPADNDNDTQDGAA